MVSSDEGTFRVRFTDANRGVMTKVFEARSETLDISADPRQQLLMPVSGVTLGQDDLMILEFDADVATTLDAGIASTLRIPITMMSMATGQRTATYLTLPEFTTANITLPAETWTEIGVYVVPAQQKIKIGHEIPDNSRIYFEMEEV